MALGLAKGKKQYDKRHDLKEKEAKREIARAFRDRKRCNTDIYICKTARVCYNNLCKIVAH